MRSSDNIATQHRHRQAGRILGDIVGYRFNEALELSAALRFPEVSACGSKVLSQGPDSKASFTTCQKGSCERRGGHALVPVDHRRRVLVGNLDRCCRNSFSDNRMRHGKYEEPSMYCIR